MMDEQRPWHRLFGLSWQDFFRGAPVRVELEKDLSLRQQLVDLVILLVRGGPLPRRLLWAMSAASDRLLEDTSMTKPLNIGMIGYGFMGRAHSNADRKVNKKEPKKSRNISWGD